MVVLAVDLSPTFLNTGTTDETFQQSGKQDSFRHLLKSSARLSESSGSQLLRTTTGIKSEPNAFEKSRPMTFLTILGCTEKLSSCRLALEGKTGRGIPDSSRLGFLEKFSVNSFALWDAEDNICGPLNIGGIADLPLLRTLLAIRQKSQEPSFWKVIDSFVVLTHANLSASRIIVNFTVDSEDLSFCYKRIKWFLWTMAAAQAAKNHGDEWG